MNSLCGAAAMQQLEHLWTLIFRILPDELPVPGLPSNLLKRLFCKAGNLYGLGTATRAVPPELPQDVLMDIFATLETLDLVRVGSVCTSWRSAYTCLRDLGLCKHSQTPCLFYTSESAGDNAAFLYSLVDDRAYKLTLPDPPIRTRFIVGSSNGWLVTADERSELHLLNPITGEQVGLPSVITIEHVKPIYDEAGVIHSYELSHHDATGVLEESTLHSPSDLRDDLYFKAFVFPDPPTRSYIVVVIHKPYFHLSFARAGHDKWTCLPHNTEYRDCIYKNGLLFALTALGEIDAFDLAASTITMKQVVGEFRTGVYESMYIIQAPWGDLLQVWRAVNVTNSRDRNGHLTDISEGEDEDGGDTWQCEYGTLDVTLYEVDVDGNALVEISGLPQHMLFLGHSNSLCLSAEGHPKLKSNHVYFTDDHAELPNIFRERTRDIGVWDLENGCKKNIVSQAWSNWPCPTWIAPNLTNMSLAFSK